MPVQFSNDANFNNKHDQGATDFITDIPHIEMVEFEISPDIDEQRGSGLSE